MDAILIGLAHMNMCTARRHAITEHFWSEAGLGWATNAWESKAVDSAAEYSVTNWRISLCPMDGNMCCMLKTGLSVKEIVSCCLFGVIARMLWRMTNLVHANHLLSDLRTQSGLLVLGFTLRQDSAAISHWFARVLRCFRSLNWRQVDKLWGTANRDRVRLPCMINEISIFNWRIYMHTPMWHVQHQVNWSSHLPLWLLSSISRTGSLRNCWFHTRSAWHTEWLRSCTASWHPI